ncbi:hypothetical protein UFOVP528_36 [uncultured Caudovirales phage]|uniref:Uncharacterized protein n=1 Tax=uncultured Caudovirales phage TaxID=2100421 RepID=A0A6J5MSZ6_9CAUD|nr:hypothetical protein UFOVP528_36 [uncultured Caudovirales phage]
MIGLIIMGIIGLGISIILALSLAKDYKKFGGNNEQQ